MHIDRSGPLVGGVLVLIIVLIAAGCASGSGEALSRKELDEEQLSSLARLNETAEALFGKAKAGSAAEALELTNQLEEQMTEIRFEGMTGVEGIHALTETIVTAKGAFVAARYNAQAGLTAAARVRLAVDALHQNGEPMWRGYYKSFQSNSRSMTAAARSRDGEGYRSRLADLQAKYYLIRPSMQISRTPSEVNKLDTLIEATWKAAEAADYGQMELLSVQLGYVADELFLNKTQHTFLAFRDTGRPIMWTISILTAILAALAYAGTRMVQFERNAIRVRRPRKDVEGS